MEGLWLGSAGCEPLTSRLVICLPVLCVKLCAGEAEVGAPVFLSAAARVAVVLSAPS